MGRAYLASLKTNARMGEAAPDDAVICARASCARPGCCFAIGEWQSDINAVAVASLTGEGVFVMSCGGPASLLSEAELRGRVAQSLADAVEGRRREGAAVAAPARKRCGRRWVSRTIHGLIHPIAFPEALLAKPSQADPQVDDRPAPGFRNGAGRAGVAGRHEDGSLPLEQSLAATAAASSSRASARTAWRRPSSR